MIPINIPMLANNYQLDLKLTEPDFTEILAEELNSVLD